MTLFNYLARPCLSANRPHLFTIQNPGTEKLPRLEYEPRADAAKTRGLSAIP